MLSAPAVVGTAAFPKKTAKMNKTGKKRPEKGLEADKSMHIVVYYRQKQAGKGKIPSWKTIRVLDFLFLTNCF